MADVIGRAAAQEASPSAFDPLTQGKGMLLIGGIVILGGVLEIHTAIKNRKVARASRSWPRVEGVVIAQRMRRSILQGFGQPVPLVTYSFEAGGQTWQHDQVVFGGLRPMRRAEAEATLRRYPVGTKVQVIHSPEDPRVCALEADSAFVNPIVYGIAMLLAGGFVVGAALSA